MKFSQIIHNMIQSFQEFMIAFRRTLMTPHMNKKKELDEEVYGPNNMGEDNGSEEERISFII